MHRSAVGIGLATFSALLLGSPAAAVAHSPSSGLTWAPVPAATMADGAGHPGHGDAGHSEHSDTKHSDTGHGHSAEMPDVAEWPEWARVNEHGADHGADSHGQDHGQGDGPARERPRTLVLGSFAAVNGAVLMTAAVLRRRTKNEVLRRRAARAAALSGPGPSRTA